MRRGLLLVLALGALVAPGGAGASTARVGATGAVDYAAAPGEVNALRASVSGSTVTLADDGATIAAGAGCSAASAHRVTCTPAGLATLSAQLGDGSDAASVLGLLPAVLDGGAGDDLLEGGDAPDVLEGGPGDDTLTAGAAGDTLYGDGPGLSVGGGADRLNGGTGTDVVDCGDGASDEVVDAETGDATSGCEGSASSAPPPPPPPPPPPTTPPETTSTPSPTTTQAQTTPPTTTPAPATAQGPVTEPPADAQPLAPAPIAPLAPPVARTAGVQAIAPVSLTLRTPSSIRRSALRRTGVRAVVTCSMACRATVRVLQSSRTIARRTITAGVTSRAVRVRATTRANAVTLRVTAPGVPTQNRRVRVTRG